MVVTPDPWGSAGADEAPRIEIIVQTFVSNAPWRERTWEIVMDPNRIDGTATKIKGTIKEAIGDATGNPRLQAEGAGDRAAGSAQAGFGRFLDAVRRLFGGRPTL